jgi:hypothetical protein
MAAHADPHLDVQVYQAAGANLVPVKLNTVDGLRAHLAALDHRLHPGESLAPLAELLDDSEEGDAVIVTSDDTLADATFQRALERSALGTVYLASVSRDGRFELQQQSRAGRKRLSVAQLSLDEILREPPAAVKRSLPLRDASKAPLPAIFRARKFPLLLSAPVRQENSWYVHEIGLLTLTGDGRLLRWSAPDHGAEQLATGLPHGRIHGATAPTNTLDRATIVLGRLSAPGLWNVAIDRQGAVLHSAPILHGNEGIRAVMVDKSMAYIATADRVIAAPLLSVTGVVYATQLRPAEIETGQIFRQVRDPNGTTTWFRAAFQTDRVGFAPVCRKELLSMFDVRGVEGPVGVTPQGDVYFTATEQTKETRHGMPLPLRCVAVSRDGLRFVLRHGDEMMLVHTLTGASQKCTDVASVEPYLQTFASPRPIRHRFFGVAVDTEGQLSLITPKRTAWSLGRPGLCFPQQATPKVLLHDKSFVEWEAEGVTGFKLQRAEFADGSVIVLDSRGLLHLRSGDLNIPECTIVLREGATAGWCADGRMWGPSYFLGERAAAPPDVIAREVIGPFVERLR